MVCAQSGGVAVSGGDEKDADRRSAHRARPRSARAPREPCAPHGARGRRRARAGRRATGRRPALRPRPGRSSLSAPRRVNRSDCSPARLSPLSPPSTTRASRACRCPRSSASTARCTLARVLARAARLVRSAGAGRARSGRARTRSVSSESLRPRMSSARLRRGVGIRATLCPPAPGSGPVRLAHECAHTRRFGPWAQPDRRPVDHRPRRLRGHRRRGRGWSAPADARRCRHRGRLRRSTSPASRGAGSSSCRGRTASVTVATRWGDGDGATAAAHRGASSHNASHGLVRWALWELVDHGDSAVTVGYRLHPQPGLAAPPRPAHDVPARRLGPGGHRRRHATSVSPTHPSATAPIPTWPSATHRRVGGQAHGAGAGSGSRSTSDPCPPPPSPVEGTEYDFRRGAPGGQHRSRHRVHRDRAVTVTPTGCGGSPCRPPTGAPRCGPSRRSGGCRSSPTWPGCTRVVAGIAVEPMTCPADAFNSRTSLLTLAPGQEWTGTWGISPV